MQLRRYIPIFIVAIIVIAAVLYGFIPKPLTVSVATVKSATLRVSIDEEGRTRVKDRFVVSSPVTGFARRVSLDVGDRVKKGQVILELEPQRSRVLDPRSRAEARAGVEAAKAALSAAKENERAAEAEAGYAEATFKRLKDLFDGGFVTRDELDHAEAENRLRGAALRSARFAVDVALHEQEAAETSLKFSSGKGAGNGERIGVPSPVSGSVLKIMRESEGVVVEGEPLIEIGNPRALEVEADLLSADAVRIAPGTDVVFERWGGTEELTGRVRVVEPTGFTKISALGVEEQRVLVIADITSPPKLWERLGDGYRVEASFILWEGEGVLQLPTSALFRYKEGRAVFVVEEEKAVRRVVELGRSNGFTAEVVKGLKEGDIVITHPDDAIDDGVKVRLRD